MRRSDVVGTSVVLALLLAGGAYLWFTGGPKSSGQSGSVPDQQANANVPNPQANAAQGGRGNRQRGFLSNLFGGGGGQGGRNPGQGGRNFNPGGGGPPMTNRGRESFTENLSALSQINLDPAFDLTVDQKAKIAALRAEYQAARDKWQADNGEELRKLDEAMRNASGQERQALDQKRQELMRTAPSSDAMVAKLKAILTAEQVKALESRASEMRREGFGGGPGGFGGGFGGFPGGGPGGPRRGEGGAAPGGGPGGGAERGQ